MQVSDRTDGRVRPPVDLEPMTWRETRRRLRADHRRLVEMLNRLGYGPRKSAYLHSSCVCVFLYRLSNYAFRLGHTLLARLLWQLNVMLTGADIAPPADLGEGLVVLCPPATAVAGKAGRNLTLMQCAGVGGEVGRWEDIGGGPGLPVLGDDVIIGPHSGVMGPVRVGSRVSISLGVGIAIPVPDDTVVEGPKVRFLRRQDLK